MNAQTDSGKLARAGLIALVFFAAALNYLDRQVLALLKPDLEAEFGWTEGDYASFVTAFQFATLAALFFVGWLIDRFGVRRVYGIGVVGWSIAGILHAFAVTVGQFIGVRIALAVAEAVNTPAAMKTAATYLPERERSMGIGIINSAPNIGVIAASLTIPFLAAAYGWKSAFIVTGVLGFVWIVLWIFGTQNLKPQPQVKAEAAPVKWGEVLADRRTWTIVGAKFLTDLVWVFMLSWLPDFFAKNFGMKLTEFSWPLALIYSLAALGAIFSGSLFPMLRARGLNYNVARKSSMLMFACVALLIPVALLTPNPWIAAVLIGVGLFAHQGFSTNVFAMATDIIPTERVATVVSLGAIAANLSGMMIALVAGWVLGAKMGYLPLFLFCGVAYLLGTAWVALLQPKLRPYAETA